MAGPCAWNSTCELASKLAKRPHKHLPSDVVTLETSRSANCPVGLRNRCLHGQNLQVLNDMQRAPHEGTSMTCYAMLEDAVTRARASMTSFI